MALTTQVAVEFLARNRSAAGISSFQRQISGLEATTRGLGRTFLTVFGLTGGLYMAGAAFRSGIREAADFEKQMANVSTLLDDQARGIIPQYTRQIRQMSQEFGESTETLSKGLYDIISASVGTAKAMDVLRVAVKAAKAGITDTAVSADAITTILNSYNLSAERAGDVSDKLFATVVRGKTTFGELAPNIGKVASLAATAGESFDDFLAALATMTRAGIQTEIAITSLRAILLAFLDPQDASIKAAAKYNLELSSQTLRTIGLTGAIQKLKKASAEELAIIVPSARAIAGFAAGIQKAEGLVEDYAFILDSTGRSQDAYNQIADTSAQQLDKFNQKWGDFKRIAGDLGIGPLTNFLGYMAKTLENSAAFAAKVRDAVRDIARSFSELEDVKTIEFKGPVVQGGEPGPYADQILALRRQQTLEMMTAIQLGGLGALSTEIKPPPSGAEKVESETARKAKESADKRLAALEKQVEAEIALTGRLNEPRQHAKMLIEYEAEAAVKYADDTDKAAAATDRFRDKLKQLERAEALARIAEGIGQAFTNAFEDMIFEAKKFEDVMRSVARNILRLAFQEAVSKPFAMGLSSLIGAAAGGLGGALAGAVSPAAGTGGGIAAKEHATLVAAREMHSGGLVGASRPSRWVPSETFDTAPRFHSLAPGESAIIARNDEVISRPTATTAQKPPMVVINNNTGQQFETDGQPKLEGEAWVVGIIARNVRQGGGIKKMLR